MKYMLLIYHNPGFLESFSEDEMSAVMKEVGELMGELEASGEWVDGQALADMSQAKVVRVRDGAPAVTDGPFVEAKEHLAGICIIEAETPERAVEIAARWPDARWNGIELRPIMDTSGTEM
jgi:hypothetical protein